MMDTTCIGNKVAVFLLLLGAQLLDDWSPRSLRPRSFGKALAFKLPELNAAQEKCNGFVEHLRDGLDGQIQSLPLLLRESVEFCFTTQANGLEMANDLKIAQCFVGMHSFMQMELMRTREELDAAALPNGDGKVSTDVQSAHNNKNKNFCKDLPDSLQQLSYVHIDVQVEQGTLNQLHPGSSTNVDEKLPQISLKSWIRSLLQQVQSDCDIKAGYENLQYFHYYCEQILFQRAYFATASDQELSAICNEARFDSAAYTCSGWSKLLVQAYLTKSVKEELLYLPLFAPSHAFVHVIDDLIQSGGGLLSSRPE